MNHYHVAKVITPTLEALYAMHVNPATIAQTTLQALKLCRKTMYVLPAWNVRKE